MSEVADSAQRHRRPPGFPFNHSSAFALNLSIHFPNSSWGSLWNGLTMV